MRLRPKRGRIKIHKIVPEYSKSGWSTQVLMARRRLRRYWNADYVIVKGVDGDMSVADVEVTYAPS